MYELADRWKPEVIARGNDRVLDWREFILRVEGAYPVDFFEVSSDPSAIARIECCFERCGVVESPTHCGIPYVITHAVLECVGLSGRLKILDTRPRRLSLIRSRDGQSLDAWVEWSWIQDIRRDCERP